MRGCVLSMLLIAGLATPAVGQSSSLLLTPPPRAGHGTVNGGPNTAARYQPGAGVNGYPGAGPNGYSQTGHSLFVSSEPRDDEVLPMTRVIEGASLYAIPVKIPRKFRVEDLITIIVRQQKKYEADAEWEGKKGWSTFAKLSDWFRFYEDHHLGQDRLSNGQPGVKFDFGNNYKTEGESDREDRFITRITARIIDVKPNGNLVLEATLEEQHDSESNSLTITGICRSSDITPDNTVLSTQMADLRIIEKNRGAVRDATRQGWVPRILSFGGGPL